MSDNVLAGQFDEPDPGNVAQDPADDAQPGGTTIGEVDLRDVPGHDHLRVEPQAGEKHLHLLRRRILRLIEDYERVVQRPPSHISERSDLDSSPLDESGGLVRTEHLKERVVERPQVGIDLGAEITREKPQTLACFDGGTGQDDATHRARHERLDGARHRQVGLAGSCRPHAKHHRVLPDGIDVALLAERLGAHDLAPADPMASVNIPDGDGTSSLTRSMTLRTRSASSASPSWTRISSSSNTVRADPADPSGPLMSSSLPRATIRTSGKASSTIRRYTSRSPRRSTIRWWLDTSSWISVMAGAVTKASLIRRGEWGKRRGTQGRWRVYRESRSQRRAGTAMGRKRNLGTFGRYP